MQQELAVSFLRFAQQAAKLAEEAIVQTPECHSAELYVYDVCGFEAK